MLKKLEDFLLNKFAGKIIARAAVGIAAYLASGSIGATISIDPNELTLAMTLGAQAVFEWFKKWRAPKAAAAVAEPAK